MKRFKYFGDVNLECGGFFWRKQKGDDYAEVVRITPCSDAGGPDNLFAIESGSVYLPDGKATKEALEWFGLDDSETNDALHVDAQSMYCGMDLDRFHGVRIVRIGPVDSFWRSNGGAWNPEPDTILRANAKLRNFVRRKFLQG